MLNCVLLHLPVIVKIQKKEAANENDVLNALMLRTYTHSSSSEGMAGVKKSIITSVCGLQENPVP